MYYVQEIKRNHALRVVVEWSPDGGVTWTAGHKVLIVADDLPQWSEHPDTGYCYLYSGQFVYRIKKTKADLFAPFFEVLEG